MACLVGLLWVCICVCFFGFVVDMYFVVLCVIDTFFGLFVLICYLFVYDCFWIGGFFLLWSLGFPSVFGFVDFGFELGFVWVCVGCLFWDVGFVIGLFCCGLFLD